MSTGEKREEVISESVGQKAHELNAAELVTPYPLMDKYVFIRELGEGANGKTWLARSLVRDALVAVKELKFSQANDQKSVDLFIREAHVLQSISVIGVPTFYESIFPEDFEMCYIVQEYVPYPSLQAIIDEKGKLSPQLTLNIAAKIARILYVLQMNYNPPVIHRDIKPSNILCDIEHGDRIKVYLIDFGAVANPQKRTGGSTVAGTLGYMSPEQMIGDIYVQSDYYSLGATMLHCLTGLHPYNIGSNVFELEFDTILRERNSSVSDALVELLHILLCKDVEGRPHNALELSNMINNVANSRSPRYDKSRADTVHPVKAWLAGMRARLSQLFEPDKEELKLWRWKTARCKVLDVSCDPLYREKSSVIPDGNGYVFHYYYEFEVDGEYCIGVSRFRKSLGNIDDLNRYCRVLYDPGNPRHNVLQSACYTHNGSQITYETDSLDKIQVEEYVFLEGQSTPVMVRRDR